MARVSVRMTHSKGRTHRKSTGNKSSNKVRRTRTRKKKQ